MSNTGIEASGLANGWATNESVKRFGPDGFAHCR